MVFVRVVSSLCRAAPIMHRKQLVWPLKLNSSTEGARPRYIPSFVSPCQVKTLVCLRQDIVLTPKAAWNLKIYIAYLIEWVQYIRQWPAIITFCLAFGSKHSAQIILAALVCEPVPFDCMARTNTGMAPSFTIYPGYEYQNVHAFNVFINMLQW